ncbi:MAG: sugar phosphate isomerase/epimerase [Acidobacteria bacterium]|nr:sugar phosphate isomerase/epimerase [Acidobacteriota bacterium]
MESAARLSTPSHQALIRRISFRLVTSIGLLLAVAFAGFAVQSGRKEIKWIQLSSKNSDLPVPGNSTQQTGSLVADLDGDGVNDFVISFRKVAPALVWYRRTVKSWDRYVIEKEFLTVEAGGAYYDIDGDSDLDLVFGGDYQSDQVWWWENPSPNFSPDAPWRRRVIKSGGKTQHHDQSFGDFKGTGKPQLAFWNQGAKTIFLADIPADPRHAESWPVTAIFSGAGGETGDQGAFKYPEGMAVADVDSDGQPDILAGNFWLKHRGGGKFEQIQIGTIGGRIAAGKLKAGKYQQVVIAPGDGIGPLRWYECTGSPTNVKDWVGHDLAGRDLVHGHSLALGDIDGDGNIDIFAAEMAKWTAAKTEPDNPNAEALIFYGDGKGNFAKTVLVKGHGFHEGRVVDLDGDGDLDILNKPYNWEVPRIDVWLQNGTGAYKAQGKPTVKSPAKSLVPGQKPAPKAQTAFEAFKGKLGLQLYSLRFEFKKNGLGPTLDWVSQQGFRALEGGGTYGLTHMEFRAELDRRGMKMVSVFASYDMLRDNVDEVIANAKVMGAEYVLCGWIPHKDAFTAEDVKKAAEVFNRAGARIRAAGLEFCYHPHGYEFVPTSKGTLFDELAAATDPKVVSFELDIFWAKHGGQDPVKLLEKYPRRFRLMHLKDLQKGVRGDLTGRAPDETSVAFGTGQIDFPAVLAAARKAGVKWYFIEEESPDAPHNIPLSLNYLARLRF